MKSALFILVICLINFTKGAVDPVAEIQKFTTCKGKRIEFPPVWSLNGAAAGSKCFGVMGDDCIKACWAHNYEGFLDGDKISKQFIRSMSNEIKGNADWHDAQKRILNEFDICVDQTPEFPNPGYGAKECPEFKTFYDCIDKKYGDICH